mgnify:CR=1 FL=1|jgi:organic radical activating enzyme
MKNYCLMATYKCNWMCDYCITDTHNQNDITNEIILAKLNDIDNDSEVSISGGEPGLIPKERLDMIIASLRAKNCIINVNTNGRFFNKFPDYYNKIDNFYYHVSENMDINDNIIDVDDPDNKIEHMLVVTDNNMHNLDAFLRRYNQYEFTVNAAISVPVNDKAGTKLSKFNAIKIYQKYKDIIHKESALFLLEDCTIVRDKLNRV